MQLSNETISILKNFGNINPGIHFKTGNTLKTVSVHKNILAEATISENIPVDFGIYDLNNFLSVVSLHKDIPNFEFDDKHVMIIGKGSRSVIKYRFCDPTMIVTPPDKNIIMPDPEITFSLSAEDFSWIMKTASVLSSPHIGIESDGNKIYIVTNDLQNDSAHTESLEIADGNGISYKMIFKTENLVKILQGNYSVDISSKGVSFFKNQDIDLKYFITLENGSYYNK